MPKKTAPLEALPETTVAAIPTPKEDDPFRIWKTWKAPLHTYLLAYFDSPTFSALTTHLQSATPTTCPKLCQILKDWDTNLPIFIAIVRYHIFPDRRTLTAIEKTLQLQMPDA